ncbi:hypothetical protein AB0D49_04800 [Streptomyces sp. NPDC048290]|uniref:hypothetical protein n=1 Tax=Streptomyces sp. NPDC048290 TaxID=3155811 RepID=UPI0034195128
MTRSLIRGRPRRAKAHISARLAQSALGVVIAVLWLGLALPVARGHRAAQQQGTSAADLALPLIVAVGAVVAGTYGYLRRTRRLHGRTTPAPAPSADAGSWPLSRLDEESRALLVAADDSVRASREELDLAAADWDEPTAAPFRHTLRHAGTELSAAFAIRQRYDEGVPREEDARRQALTGIAGRCTEAGRLLDARTPALDAARRLESDPGPALRRAEARFRELTARIAPAERTVTELAGRHTPGATAPVTGFVEQARDRLVFAALALNRSRQRADRDEPGPAAAGLRAAEGAIVQAAVLLDAVDGLAADLRTAQALLPAALDRAETDLAARDGPDTETVPAHLTLTAVRAALADGGPYDPLELLRRVGRAAPATAADLPARSGTATADAYVTTHRAAVSAAPRTLLATAFRLLDTDPVRADELARRARELAEQEVRTHGNPYPEDSGHEAGTAGAVLGGVLLDEGEDAGPPVSFGGPHTRGRLGGV